MRRSRLEKGRLSALVLAALILAMAAASPVAAAEETDLEQTSGALLAAGIVAGLAIWAAILFYFFVRPRLARVRTQEEAETRQFEQTMISQFGGRRASASKSASAQLDEVNAGGSPAAPQAEAPRGSPMPGTEPPSTGDAAMDEAIARLHAGGLLERVEGPEQLGPDLPPGQILALTDGKRALLLPPGASAEQAAARAPLVDLVILAQPEGKALACVPLSRHIADRLFKG